MWIKVFANGSVVAEDRQCGITWLKTPLTGLVEVELQVKGPRGDMVHRNLRGFNQYWHSRASIANDSCKPIIVAERIQGLQDDGKWFTITWNGQHFIDSIEDRAIGKPVIK
jgi:hypothetical protein